MNTTEQVVKILCPAAKKKVNLRIIYEVEMGKACPIWAEPVFKECLEIDDCLVCGQKNDKCLLQNENIPACCIGRF